MFWHCVCFAISDLNRSYLNELYHKPNSESREYMDEIAIFNAELCGLFAEMFVIETSAAGWYNKSIL